MTDDFDQYVNNINTELEIPMDLEDLIDLYLQYLDVYITEDKTSGIIELRTIRARKDAPKGSGTSFMMELCKWADKNNRIIVLQTATKETRKDEEYKITSSSNRLSRFYGRFGFVSNYSKRDYRADLPGNMHRYPRK